jgi:GT2 family glycosyltransferase
MKVSVVIPAYNHFQDLTGERLMELYQNCSVDEVIVVDDCSPDEKTHDGYKFWQRITSFPLKVIHNNENLGFLKSSNRGLKEATGDIVALLSNDVKIKKDLGKLLNEIFTTPPDKTLLGGRLLDWDTGWNTFNGRIFPYVEGWALITSKSGWEELGYFDEQFAPHDMEDVDISTTAVSKGFGLMVFPPWHGDVFEHVGAQSIGYTDERRAITEAHRELFRAKWIKVNP